MQVGNIEEPEFERLERPSVVMMDGLLGQPFGVLDHGFVRLVDYMGDQSAVVQAARVSYGKGTKTASDDRGLLRYLMRNWHSTPFEMCEIKLHVKLPVFVARQWIRHRTANVNEYSARYSILSGEFYIPEPEQVAAQSSSNKQGRGNVLSAAEADAVRRVLMQDAEAAYDHYAEMISQDGQQGIARELARINLPANVYTEWYWKVDLHNLLHFLRLRADPHAQWEIRQYANVLCDLVQAWVPDVWEAFEDYRLYAETFSRQEMEALRNVLGLADIHEAAGYPEGLSDRERAEFRRKLGAG